MLTEPVEARPGFDLIYYMDLGGHNRIEAEVLEPLEAAWEAWQPYVHAFRLVPENVRRNAGGEEEGFLLVFLDEEVESAVEDAWAVSPERGESFHNLAVAMVMLAAQCVMPELAEVCAPLPKPGEAAKAAFAEVGMPWNEAISSAGRQYALFTFMPYRGGCELCVQSATCPNSTLANQ
jgi:hypothetical protein